MSNAALPVEPLNNLQTETSSAFNAGQVNTSPLPSPLNLLFSRLIYAAGLISIAVLTIAEFTGWRGWDFDDAMIVYRIVGNLINKGIWAYNIGEQHNPSTSILNPILIAGIARSGFSIPLAGHILWAASVLASGILTTLLLEKYPVGLRVLAGYTVTLLLARNSSIGLETNLFACGLLLLMVLEQKNRSTWFVIGILALIRPDALLLVPVKFAFDYGRRPFSIMSLTLVAIPLLPWVVFSMVQFGTPFPDTLLNKIWQGSSGYWGQGWIYLKGGWKHIEAASWISKASYLLAPAGAFFAFKAGSPLRLIIVFCMIRETAYAFLNVPGYHWYYANDDLCTLLCGWLLVGKVVNDVTNRLVQFPTVRRRWALAAVLLLAVHSGYSFWEAEANPRIDPRNEAYRKAISAVSTKYPGASTLGVLEVGTPGYFANDVRMVDLIGLASANHEYITGRYNDEFFQNPPKVLLLHNPIWHFERALTEDIRFDLYYEDPQPVDDPAMPMQFYGLRSTIGDAVTGGTTGIESFVRARYSPLRVLSDAAPVQSDPAALCIIDQVNGILNSPETIRVKHVLSVRGWAVDTKNPPAEETSAEVVLLEPTTLKPRYVLPMTRHERVDVAEHLNNLSLKQAGIDGKGYVVDVTPGLYTLGIRQMRASNNANPEAASVCLTSSRIEVVR